MVTSAKHRAIILNALIDFELAADRYRDASSLYPPVETEAYRQRVDDAERAYQQAREALVDLACKRPRLRQNEMVVDDKQLLFLTEMARLAEHDTVLQFLEVVRAQYDKMPDEMEVDACDREIVIETLTLLHKRMAEMGPMSVGLGVALSDASGLLDDSIPHPGVGTVQ